MLRLMESAATATGLIPEQVWDADDIADKALFRGQSTTSACPLVWAHAEYIKLIRSLRDGKIFDQPEQTARRYAKGHHRPRMQVWRFEQKLRELCKGENLRIETLAAAMVRWSVDGWKKTSESATTDTGLGIHYVDLPTEHMPPGSEVSFTFHWKVADRWEDADFRVAVVDHQCAK
jgi:glucoamylase